MKWIALTVVLLVASVTALVLTPRMNEALQKLASMAGSVARS